MVRRRHRGGQPGNQNARKHGFFSENLTPEELQSFWDIIRHRKKSPEVALVYAKLSSSLRRSPGNPVVLDEAATLLANLSAARLALNRTEGRELKKAILALWENCAVHQILNTSSQLVERKNESSAL